MSPDVFDRDEESAFERQGCPVGATRRPRAGSKGSRRAGRRERTRRVIRAVRTRASGALALRRRFRSLTENPFMFMR